MRELFSFPPINSKTVAATSMHSLHQKKIGLLLRGKILPDLCSFGQKNEKTIEEGSIWKLGFYRIRF